MSPVMSEPEKLLQAFELTFSIKVGHPSYTGKIHTMAFEARSKEYLLASITDDYEVHECKPIPHPQHDVTDEAKQAFYNRILGDG